MIKPGCLLWAGSDEKQHGQIIPWTAIDVWENEMGWRDQHHILWLGLHRTDNRGLQLQIDLAKRILDDGGEVQWMIWGTPESMASVPTDWKDPSGRLVYPKHPPRDYDEWAGLYARTVKAIIKNLGTNRQYYSIWSSANRWQWRSSNRRFFGLYAVVQDEIEALESRTGQKIKLGAPQVDDILDLQVHDQEYTSTPALDWLNQFLRNWPRCDFIPLFQYVPPDDDPISTIINRVLEIEDVINGWDRNNIDLIFNSLAPGRGHVEPEWAQYTLRLAKALTHTGVSRACFDYLQDSERGKENGLLDWNLNKYPRWQAAEKIIRANY